MYNHFFKRLIDIVVALIALPFVLLITLIVGLAIKLDDGGPVFYLARRISKGGGEFKMFKFRSMYVNAPDIRMENGDTYNGEDDPRVTRVGRFMRKTSVDEIPQFLNVLIGDMTLIGPRPDTLDFLEVYKKEAPEVLTIKPGITGYNQAYFRNSIDGGEKMRNDAYYAKNLTFWMDAKIFLKTAKSVLLRENINHEA